ncbi:MAG: DUF2520 domain-containing protein [Oscillospiraceae bacterium]|nr:DUF2520 domain-containing protein [Oscillospiraceae bacterium]
MAMKIGFIGAGKVGFSLGKFFSQGGVPVTGYWSRRRESAQEAAAFTGTRAYQEPARLVQDSDALFLTVPDGAISSVFCQLKKSGISGKQICHCSGAMSAGEAFPGIGQTGACGYSIHPLFPISSRLESYRELPGAFFCLEGDGPHLTDWEGLLTGLGARVQRINGAEKARYHAACAISSNLMCALVGESQKLLEGCGFSPQGALEALAPLMRGNLEHLIACGPVQALTGPVERGDAATVQKHLACFETPQELELYRVASRKLVELAREKNPGRDYAKLEQILN